MTDMPTWKPNHPAAVRATPLSCKNCLFLDIWEISRPNRGVTFGSQPSGLIAILKINKS